METLKLDSGLARLLDWARSQRASDLHGRPNREFCVRIDGRLARVPAGISQIPGQAEIERLLSEGFSAEVCEQIRSAREFDWSFYHGEHRYRANASKQKGFQSFSFRHVPQQRQRLADLNLPNSLKCLMEQPRGLILATGPTGQGKSTTLRALIEEINQTKALRIITIEDPIEHVFQEAHCEFEQREVGIDTASFEDGIRNAMRQDPNIIFVGEIRDRASIFAAMQAAETGHLVLTTLHADSVPQAIGRIREFYPTSEQNNVSSLLARNLSAVVCQRLLPNTQGTRTPCLEVMKRDFGTQEAIQTNNLQLLGGIIEAAVGQGMHSFDQYLYELLAAGAITEETARQYAVNRHRLIMMLRGIFTTTPILVLDR
ncbi:MAG: pilT [Verrucomicrobiales bacterium]|nr:pilT [Verrucomicrobiales bacterium]